MTIFKNLENPKYVKIKKLMLYLNQVITILKILRNYNFYIYIVTFIMWLFHCIFCNI